MYTNIPCVAIIIIHACSCIDIHVCTYMYTSLDKDRLTQAASMAAQILYKPHQVTGGERGDIMQ